MLTMADKINTFKTYVGLDADYGQELMTTAIA